MPSSADLTIHSTKKSYSIGSSFGEPNSGNVFLIVDFSVKNNMRSTYQYNPNYVVIEDEKHYTYDYSWYSSELTGYFGMTSIQPGTTKRGTLAFDVPLSSHTYTMTLKSDMFGFGDELAIADIGIVSTPEQDFSGTLSIKNVDYDWTDAEYIPDYGYIQQIECRIANTGNVPFEPRFDILVKHGSETVYVEENAEASWLFSALQPGSSEDISFYIHEDIDEDGEYSVKVTMKSGLDGEVLDSDTKSIDIE